MEQDSIMHLYISLCGTSLTYFNVRDERPVSAYMFDNVQLASNTSFYLYVMVRSRYCLAPRLARVAVQSRLRPIAFLHQPLVMALALKPKSFPIIAFLYAKLEYMVCMMAGPAMIGTSSYTKLFTDTVAGVSKHIGTLKFIAQEEASAMNEHI